MTDKNIPENLRYTKEHEWTKLEDNFLTIGITHHAQAQLGDVVYLELPEKGDTITAEDTFGVVESVKAVSDLFAPVTGEVIESNAELVDTPEKVNSEPYASWMLKIKPSNPEELESLMSSADYAAYIQNESH